MIEDADISAMRKPTHLSITARDDDMESTGRQIDPTGKSLLLFFGNRVKPQNKKYFAFPEGRNSGICIAIPSRYEGRFAIVISAGRGAVDAEMP
jgi:hypothetical protein